MKKLFDYDNPVLQTLGRFADLAMLSILFLLCCLPVVTAGTAAAALFKAVYDLTLERGGEAVKTFFHAMKRNFRQATAAWMLALIGFASVFCDWLLLKIFFQGTSFTILACLVLVLALTLAGLLCWLFPLIARYENTLREHIQNALILMVRYFPKTLAMVLIQLLPLLTASFIPHVFLDTLLIWILFCPGFSVQANAFLLRPVFEKLESDASKKARKAT